MYKNLLVPLDGSPFSERALPLASAIARSSGAVLSLVHVHVPSFSVYGGLDIGNVPVVDETWEAELREHETAYLEARVQEMGAQPGLQVTSALLDGPVAETIVEYAAQTGVDLVVMTTHGRGGMARFWLGSVADDLVRHSHVPILLIRPHEGMVQIEAEHPFRNILIPLDGSPLAEQSLDPAVKLGRLVQAEYTLVQVVEPLVLPGYSPVAYAAGVAEQATESLVETARTYLDSVAQRLRTEGLEVHTRVLLDAQPARVILEDAEQHAISLIALATHGRGGISRLLIGSVADKVLRGSDAPVLLYRPRE